MKKELEVLEGVVSRKNYSPRLKELRKAVKELKEAYETPLWRKAVRWVKANW